METQNPTVIGDQQSAIKNPPHVEKLLTILKSKSQNRLPKQIRSNMEFNPLLQKYIDEGQDQKLR